MRACVCACVCMCVRVYMCVCVCCVCHHSGFAIQVVLEKPQGHDWKSAEALSEELLDMFEEEQLYRTDHYLAKSVVTNILPFRLVSKGLLEDPLDVLFVSVCWCVLESCVWVCCCGCVACGCVVDV